MSRNSRRLRLEMVKAITRWTLAPACGFFRNRAQALSVIPARHWFALLPKAAMVDIRSWGRPKISAGGSNRQQRLLRKDLQGLRV